MPVWTLAKKDFRLLMRDRMAAGLLVAMPILFTLTLGLLLGENFGQEADDTLRISLVDTDRGGGVIPDPAQMIYPGAWGLLGAPGGQGPLLASSLSLLAPDPRPYYVPDPKRVPRAAATAVGL